MSNEKKKAIAEVGFVVAEVAWLMASGATAEDFAVFVVLLAAKLAASRYLDS